jgi:hypothetical protein
MGYIANLCVPLLSQVIKPAKINIETCSSEATVLQSQLLSGKHPFKLIFGRFFPALQSDYFIHFFISSDQIYYSTTSYNSHLISCI